MNEYTPATVTRSDHFNIEKKICNEIDGDISLLARSPTLKLTLIHCVFPQARFDAGELITQRELVSRQVSEDLTERASTFGLILDDVSLV